jgi:hypothetical protein
MTRRHVFCSLLVIALGALLLSCASTSDLTSISITPPTASVGPNGSQVQFTATALYTRSSHGSTTKDVTNQVTWASSNTAVATVDSAGVATAVGVGIVNITANMNGFSASASMDVTIGAGSLAALTIIPSSQAVFATGQTAQFIAIGTFTAGPTTQDMTDQVTWIAHDVAVATINSTGLATSLPCTTPAGVCSTAITAIATNVNGASITATTSLTTSPNTNNPPLLPSLTVYKVGQGSGTVVSTSEVGINCGSGASCTANFSLNTNVTLSETAAAGSTFVEWSSNCNGGTNLDLPTCTVPMQNNQTVGAIFARNPTP